MKENTVPGLIKAPGRYQNSRGNADFVYESICKIISGKADSVDWARFGPQEWDLLILMAGVDMEGVAPFIFAKLREGNRFPPGMPEQVRVTLRSAYYNTLAQNTLMYKELARILDAFEKMGVEALVLKGAALAVSAYQDIGHRPMGDIDLLVRPRDLQRAWKIIENLNYHLLAANTEIVLRNTDGPEIGVDLHWCLLTPYGAGSAAVDWFSKDLQRSAFPAGSVRMLTLTPAPHAAFVAAHGFGHPILRNFLDLDLLLASPDMDRSEAAQVAREAGWEAMFNEMVAQKAMRFDPTGPGASFPEMPVVNSRTNIVLQAWSLVGGMTMMTLFFRIIFPTRAYLVWRYGDRARRFLPVWILIRWCDFLLDLFKTVFPGRRKIGRIQI